MLTPQIASNMNFPAPLAVLAFLAAVGGLVLYAAAAAIAWFARKPRLARICLIAVSGGAVLYLALLFGFSLASHPRLLALGEEKYFCEIDCHLAYSLLDVTPDPAAAQTMWAQPPRQPALRYEGSSEQSQPALTHYVVTIRTRFDETTTSSSRPKDAPLAPSPRTIYLEDNSGHQYLPTAQQGTPLLTPLKPADSYTTKLAFDVPPSVNPKNLRLLITTTPAWPDRVVIGDENSLLHHKTYFAL